MPDDVVYRRPVDLSSPDEASAVGLELFHVVLGVMFQCGLSVFGLILTGAGHGTGVFLSLHFQPLPSLGEVWGLSFIGPALFWGVVGIATVFRRYLISRLLATGALAVHFVSAAVVLNNNWEGVSRVARSLPPVVGIWAAVYAAVCLPQLLALILAWLRSFQKCP